MHPKNLTNHTF